MVVNQVNGTYKKKVPCLTKYLEIVKGFLKSFEHFELERILWLENNQADALAKFIRMKTSNGS